MNIANVLISKQASKQARIAGLLTFLESTQISIFFRYLGFLLIGGGYKEKER